MRSFKQRVTILITRDDVIKSRNAMDVMCRRLRDYGIDASLAGPNISVREGSLSVSQSMETGHYLIQYSGPLTFGLATDR